MTTTQRDYYEVLGVARDADAKTIKDAFRKLALQYHPDRNKAPEAEARFKEIAEAYAVLSDPKKRADYNARGFAGVAGFSPEDLFGGIDFGNIFAGRGFDFGESIFDRFFGRRRRTGPQSGATVEVALTIPLERIFTGGEETVRLRHPTTCQSCHGSGAKAGTQPRPCPTCDGRGQQVQSQQRGGVTFQQITPCTACHGRAVIIDTPCPDCDGQGLTQQEETLTVKIPIGAEEGMALRIPGRGQPSPVTGGPPGDLYVVVYTAPHARFERRGADLWHVTTVSIPDVVLGASLDLEAFHESLKVTIPTGTQPGTILRLRGHGLPEFGHEARGDLYVVVNVQVPEKLSRDERDLYQRLRALTQRGTR